MYNMYDPRNRKFAPILYRALKRNPRKRPNFGVRIEYDEDN